MARRAATSTSPALIQQIQTPPFDARRRDRPGVVLPAEGPLRAGDAAEQPARLARASRPGWKASRSTSAACSTRPRASRASSILSIAHLGDAERMFFVSLLLNQVARLDADAVRHDEPARARSTWTRSSATSRRSRIRRRKLPLLTLLKQARAFGARRRAGDAEPGRPRLQGARRTPAPGSSAGCRPSATRRACSTGWKAPPPARAARFDRGEMEEILAGLGNRVFLMNNVHEDAPGGLPDALGAVVPARPAHARPDQDADGRRGAANAPSRGPPRRGAPSAAGLRRPRGPPLGRRVGAAGDSRSIPVGAPGAAAGHPAALRPRARHRPAGATLVYQPMLLGAAAGALRRRQEAPST